MATIAVFLVLGGGAALAAGTFTGRQKKQVGKIATKVFNKKIGGASVNHAGSADTATKASTATKATEATKATTATKASAAEKFGGRLPAEYQRKLKAGCLPPSAIAGISNEGDVTCSTPVSAIRITAAAGENIPQELGNGLRLLVVCHDGGIVQLAFLNVGGATGGRMGWIYGTGTGAANVGQEELVSGSGEKECLFSATSVESRIVYAIGNNVMTINVNARDATTLCEVRGTVESAS